MQIVYVQVDMSVCGFTKIPNVVFSYEVDPDPSMSLVTASIYKTTPISFRVYLHNEISTINIGLLERKTWNIDWIAVGFTC